MVNTVFVIPMVTRVSQCISKLHWITKRFSVELSSVSNTMKAFIIQPTGETIERLPADGKRFTTQELRDAIGDNCRMPRLLVMNDGRIMAVNSNPSPAAERNLTATKLYTNRRSSSLVGNALVFEYDMF